MGKGISFGEKDKELIKKIEEFQKKNDLDYFIEAVRKPCEVALEFEKTVSKIK